MLSIPALHRMRDDVQNNFHNLAHDVSVLRGELRTAKVINTQLIQLLNWIATTHPQILNEFQTTATAFDKLLPRDVGDSDVACAQT